MSISVCLSVCLYVRITSLLQEVRVTHVAVARSFSLGLYNILCTYGFVDDVTFCHSGPYVN